MKKSNHLSHILIALLVIVVVCMGIWMCRLSKKVGESRKVLTEEQLKDEMVMRIQQAKDVDVDEDEKASMITSIQSN